MGVVQEHPLAGQPVEVRRLADLIAVAAERFRRLVVGEDEQEVRPLGRANVVRMEKARNKQERDHKTARTRA